MKRILFCLLAPLAMIGCGKAQPPGTLGGLSPAQASQLTDFQSSWNDARTAYQNAASIASTLPPGRALQMARALQSSQCVPSVSGVPDQAYNRTWSYQRSLGGGDCPISAGDSQGFSKSNGSGTYALGYAYGVQSGTHQDFQRLNPLRSFRLSGNLSVIKQGNGASTSGHFGLDAQQGNSHITGSIDVGNGRVDVEIDFPNMQVTGSAQWSNWGTPVPPKYYVQGVNVNAGIFNAAFNSFAVPDIVNKAQEIPHSL